MAFLIAEIPSLEEIASVLRPYMESKEARNVVQDLCDETRVLKEEIQRKDEEITKVKKMLEDLCDIIEKNKSIHIWETRNRAMLAKKELKLIYPPDDGTNGER